MRVGSDERGGGAGEADHGQDVLSMDERHREEPNGFLVSQQVIRQAFDGNRSIGIVGSLRIGRRIRLSGRERAQERPRKHCSQDRDVKAAHAQDKHLSQFIAKLMLSRLRWAEANSWPF